MRFRLIFELEPPRGPDLKKVLRQIELFGPLVDAVLIPDNHLGIPALSPIAIALEVRNQGFQPIVVMNSRDRNALRMESDLLTLRAYGIEEVLFVGGDKVEGVPFGVSVRQMLRDSKGEGLRKGVVATIGRPLGWRQSADFLVTKLAFGRSKAGYWREAQGFAQPVYCGVIALSDRDKARRVIDNIPDLNPPRGYLEAFEADGDAGFQAAINELDDLLNGGLDGAHLVVPFGRKRFAELLENWSESRGIRR